MIVAFLSHTITRELAELLMPKVNGKCQRICTENIEFSIVIEFVVGRTIVGRGIGLLY